MTFASIILVPTDFSDASRLAVEAAATLALQLGASIQLLHVHEHTLSAPASFGLSPEQLSKAHLAAHASSQAELVGLRTGPLKKVKDVHTAILDASPAAEAICDHAKKVGIDLIVMATHGRSGLAHFLIGSVTERVVRHAPCPVLVLRSSAKD